jgi:hypothetical protein
MNSKDIALAAKYALEFLKRRSPERSDKKDNKLDSTPRFTSIEIIDATEDNLLKNPKG